MIYTTQIDKRIFHFQYYATLHYTIVLIISYDLFRMNKEVLSKATHVGLLVADEGHRLKNTSGSLTLSALNSLKCKARLLIGTPIQVQQTCVLEYNLFDNAARVLSHLLSSLE